MSPELYQTLLNHKAIAYYNDLTDVCSAPAVGLMNPDFVARKLAEAAQGQAEYSPGAT